MEILTIIGSILTLAILIFKAVVDSNAVKKAQIDAEDKKIDSITNADDTIVELDRLRNEPAANRP